MIPSSGLPTHFLLPDSPHNREQIHKFWIRPEQGLHLTDGCRPEPSRLQQNFAGAGYDNFRSRIFTVRTKKCITTCIKSGNRSIDGVNSVMVSSFPVLGFMIDGGTMDFNLADGVVTLEVCHIVHCIPETELYIRKNGKMLFFFTVVGHGQLIDLAGASNRNEVCQLCGKIILLPLKME